MIYQKTSVVLLSLFITVVGFTTSPADTDVTNSDQAVNQQLLDIQQQLDMQKDNLEQQKKQAEALEKSVDCNWKLLQAYNHCKVLNNDDVKGQLGCVKEAKINYQQCMDAVDSDAE